MVLAIVGAALAPYVIERMTDHGFRQWTRAIIFLIAGGLSGARRLAGLAGMSAAGTSTVLRHRVSAALRKIAIVPMEQPAVD